MVCVAAEASGLRSAIALEDEILAAAYSTFLRDHDRGLLLARIVSLVRKHRAAPAAATQQTAAPTGMQYDERVEDDEQSSRAIAATDNFSAAHAALVDRMRISGTITGAEATLLVRARSSTCERSD